MATVAGNRDVIFALIVLRLLLVAMAAVAIYTGYVLLTSPLLLPVTIGIWLSAIVMLVLAIAAKLPARFDVEDRAVQRFTHRRAA